MKMNMTPPGKKPAGRTDRRSPHLIYAACHRPGGKGYATGGEAALRFSNSGITVQEGDYDGYKIDGTD
ncbi:MAG: hypothetical protein V8S34_02025 [Lawsonibacter sp.]